MLCISALNSDNSEGNEYLRSRGAANPEAVQNKYRMSVASLLSDNVALTPKKINFVMVTPLGPVVVPDVACDVDEFGVAYIPYPKVQKIWKEALAMGRAI